LRDASKIALRLPVEILRANSVLRGVALPAGEHPVIFRFVPAALLSLEVWGVPRRPLV